MRRYRSHVWRQLWALAARSTVMSLYLIFLHTLVYLICSRKFFVVHALAECRHSFKAHQVRWLDFPKGKFGKTTSCNGECFRIGDIRSSKRLEASSKMPTTAGSSRWLCLLIPMHQDSPFVRATFDWKWSGAPRSNFLSIPLFIPVSRASTVCKDPPERSSRTIHTQGVFVSTNSKVRFISLCINKKKKKKHAVFETELIDKQVSWMRALAT